MVGKPREPDASEPAASADRGAACPARPEERCGVVQVARHVKDDGRALLLYTYVGERGPA
jgi:hypothetical protein